MISATVRLRLKPWRPVEQNEHSRAHPACDETQSVPRFAHVKQPFARAVGRGGVTQDPGGLYDGELRKTIAQLLRHIGHGAEIIHPGMMHPAQQLFGTIGLFAQVGAERLELLAAQPEQIYGHRALTGKNLQRREKIGNLDGGGLR
jgi:hypothetical protein